MLSVEEFGRLLQKLTGLATVIYRDGEALEATVGETGGIAPQLDDPQGRVKADNVGYRYATFDTPAFQAPTAALGAARRPARGRREPDQARAGRRRRARRLPPPRRGARARRLALAPAGGRTAARRGAPPRPRRLRRGGAGRGQRRVRRAGERVQRDGPPARGPPAGAAARAGAAAGGDPAGRRGVRPRPRTATGCSTWSCAPRWTASGPSAAGCGCGSRSTRRWSTSRAPATSSSTSRRCTPRRPRCSTRAGRPRPRWRAHVALAPAAQGRERPRGARGHLGGPPRQAVRERGGRAVPLPRSQAAVSIENVDLHETVQRQAVTDELTGLFNHRRFQEVVSSEVERARRFGQRDGPDHARHRQLQARQRHLRPPPGRPRAARGGARAPRVLARGRRARALRRRGDGGRAAGHRPGGRLPVRRARSPPDREPRAAAPGRARAGCT